MEKTWRRIIAIEPENLKAHSMVIVNCCRLDALEDAIAEYQAATLVEPGNAVLFYGLDH